jgi:hypothetical protein
MRVLCVVLSTAALTLSPILANGQAIRGTVRDQTTGRPVVAASVWLLNHRNKDLEHVLTDSTGVFLVEPDDAGTYGLRLQALGYKATTAGPVDVTYGEMVEVSLELAADAVPLQPLTVTARSHPPNRYLTETGFYERKKSGQGVYMTREDIMRRAPEDFSDLMRTTTGMAIQPTGVGGHRGWTTTTRSTSQCQPTLILDGVTTNVGGQSPLRVRDIPLDDVLLPNDIQGLELYKGPATVPPQFNVNNASCGVLVIWTRRK